MPTIERKLLKIHKQTYQHENRSEIFYGSKLWHILRNDFIKEHPLCEECYKKGIIKQAEHVHHVIPFLNGQSEAEQWDLFSDENNLMSLCLDCHHEKHKNKKNILKKM